MKIMNFFPKERSKDAADGPKQDCQFHAEYGRWQDVQRLFGIKRGILYRLIAERKIKSISLREPGKRFGCRLIYLPSVSEYLNGLMQAQNATALGTKSSKEQTAHAPGE